MKYGKSIQRSGTALGVGKRRKYS